MISVVLTGDISKTIKININTKHPEFDAYQFVGVKQVFEIINHFKRNIYVKVIKYFEEKGYI